MGLFDKIVARHKVVDYTVNEVDVVFSKISWAKSWTDVEGKYSKGEKGQVHKKVAIAFKGPDGKETRLSVFASRVRTLDSNGEADVPPFFKGELLGRIGILTDKDDEDTICSVEWETPEARHLRLMEEAKDLF